MTKLHADLEALMPEPAYRITSKMGEFICLRSKSYDNKKGDKLFSEEQVRAAILGATERAAKLNGAEIAAYTLPAPDGSKIDEIRIERARQMSGAPLWAVRFRGDVLNKNGEWEWEPMPSGRDDTFLARARFDTAEEAIAAASASQEKEGEEGS